MYIVGRPPSNSEYRGLAEVLGPFLQGWKVVGELTDLGGGEGRRECVLIVYSLDHQLSLECPVHLPSPL